MRLAGVANVLRVAVCGLALVSSVQTSVADADLSNLSTERLDEILFDIERDMELLAGINSGFGAGQTTSGSGTDSGEVAVIERDQSAPVCFGPDLL